MTQTIQAEQIFIFTGPTLAPSSAAETLDAIYLPPVKMGDIYRICELFSPRVIGIIDGYFNQVPSVWHKEIHYALSQGIHVFGAASMGALRAAEMQPLGMIGCGEIYRAYQHGSLALFDDELFENDDEVAVVHGPAELNYLAASDALVNMRFTLAAAVHSDIIDKDVAQQLISIAGDLFYAQRRYTKVLEIAARKKLPAEQIESLRHWLNENKINQKQLDAVELLSAIKTIKSRPGLTQSNQVPFEHTSQWQAAIDEINGLHFWADPVINELRLKGESYFELLDQLETNSTIPSPAPADPKPLSQLHASPGQLDRYLSQLWCKAATRSDSASAIQARTEQLLLDVLEQNGALSGLMQRAEDKQAMLARSKKIPAIDKLSELDRLQLCDWYFSTQLNSQIPDYPHQYAATLGFTNEDDFYAMLLAEYFYIESRQETSE